jgi:hypothetical protein
VAFVVAMKQHVTDEEHAQLYDRLAAILDEDAADERTIRVTDDPTACDADLYRFSPESIKIELAGDGRHLRRQPIRTTAAVCHGGPRSVTGRIQTAKN